MLAIVRGALPVRRLQPPPALRPVQLSGAKTASQPSHHKALRRCRAAYCTTTIDDVLLALMLAVWVNKETAFDSRGMKMGTP